VLTFRSIISRILWLHVVVVICASIALPLMLYQLLAAETNNLHRRAMREQADYIIHRLSHGDGGWHLDVSDGMRALYSEAYGRYAYAIRDGDGRIVLSSRRSNEQLFPDDRPRGEPTQFETVRGGDLIAGVGVPATVDGRKVWIEVAESMSHRDVLTDDVVSNFFTAVAWVTLPILLLVIVIDAVIIRRAFRPVLAVSRQARDIGPRRTDVRLEPAGMPNEVRPLVEAINQALDRLDHGYRVLRQFSADAAHELRTPLAILRTRIDTMKDRDAASHLRGDVELMTRTVGQLLEIAELESVVVDAGERVELRKVCADVVAFMAPLALEQGKDIALGGVECPIWVAGDAEMITRAVRNLVENAVRHTPAKSAVDVIVEDDGGVLVCDAGPGIRDSDRENLFRRFWRKDRSRPGSAGLGLSIVRQIVDIHGGTVTVDNRPEGGAEFRVTFGRPIDVPERS
jgi:signal transduction histidine kinase